MQGAGQDKLRYEVSYDRNQETQELRRLVLALRVQNDQLVAATQYLLEQVKKWQQSTSPQTQRLGQLVRGIEEKLGKQVLADLATPIMHDTTSLQKDMSQPRPQDLAKPIPDLTPQVLEHHPQMVSIRAGRFLMGSSIGEGNGDEQPQHEVQITVPFLLSQTEVTQGQYLAVTGSRPSQFGEASDWEQRPVENVSWLDAAVYCNRLSHIEGIESCYVIAGEDVKWPKGHACTGYRLPTEAEWEYAARAEQPTKFAGLNDAMGVAWNKDNANSSTHRVASKRANAWGIYDMSGNVFEWVWDRYDSYQRYPGLDPRGPLLGGSYRVLRGGSWDSAAWGLRVALRVSHLPSYRYQNLGIRLSKSNP